MDAKFWLERWENSETGFHREDANANLRRFWPRLNLPPKSTVFVPLCGRSSDMPLLAQNGHKIIGVELSDIAIKMFFEKQNLAPDIRQQDGFDIWSAGPYELWVGDMFKLPGQLINNCSAVYDRASLVAFPREMQKDYSKLLAAHLAGQAQILLVSLSYDQTEMEGPPFSTPADRIEDLFQSSFDIKALDHAMTLEENGNLKKRGLTSLTESCYLLKKR